jgi:hypothetical protein
MENGLIYLPLTNGTEAFVDDTPANRELVLRRNWSANAKGYAAAKICNRVRTLHRLLVPGALIVDHANRNILDNRACNLREVTRSENALNSKPRYGRALKGAYARANGKWQCLISLNGKVVGGGTFETMEDAHARWLELATLRNPDFVRGS